MSAEPAAADRPFDSGVIRSILAIVFARLVINVSKRFAYPFVSAIGSTFGVSAVSVQNVIALTNGAGLFSPLLGTISEHFGRKTVMVGALLMMTVMSLLGALFAEWGVFVLVMFALGVGKITYDPTFQAYLGDVIPFSRRARVMGFAELSWALSLVIAAPVAGFLLEASSLQAVFLFIAALLGLGTLAVWLFVEADADPQRSHDRLRVINPLAAMRRVSRHPPAMFALLFSVCLTTGHETFFINYGLWMEDSFDLQLTALGTLTILIAIAEIVGEFIVITLADRLGTKRAAATGMLMAAGCFFFIPSLSFSLPLAMLGIFVLFVSIETAIVASLPLFTEVMPDARAVMMSANQGAHSLGRVVGAALGASIYQASGGDFALIGTLAGLLGLVAALSLLRGVRIGNVAQK
ncbi:MAG: MFS transporter [Chloroflexi bacterium]|nr:MFS transporter [Chloroflexota bacterium]MCY4248319.1 MFS transporter [Chloroflexota bacterium]